MDSRTAAHVLSRKGWLVAADVLNTRDASSVTAFAQRRRP